jgi:hypothetical protein
LEKLRAEYQHELEELKDALARKREAATKSEEAQRLVARYRDPLLQSTFDLQSRLFNVLRPGGFRGGRDPDYFRLSTLFVLAEFLGWMEIIRREMQFLDLGTTTSTKELGGKLEPVQDVLASTSRWRDEYYIYRGEQRAIGELMLVRLGETSSAGPRHECLGYASFVAKQDDPHFAKWFGRLGEAIQHLPGQRPDRLVEVQDALIDIIDFLDPHHERFQGRRSRWTRRSLGRTGNLDRAPTIRHLRDPRASS